MVCDPLVSARDLSLPRCMRAEPLKETNLSPQYATFKPAKFARFQEEDADRLLSSLMPFRLYHSQSGSFVSASCDREKTCIDPSTGKRVPRVWRGR